MRIANAVVALFLFFGFAGSAAEADQYYRYQYKQFTVISQGSADQARSLAHNLYRLDLAIAAVLQAKSASWRPPVDVYAVPGDMFSTLSGLGKDSGSVSKVTPLGSTLLINTSEPIQSRWWSTYFAFGNSVLGMTYSFRFPPWFSSGLAEVFAASTVDYTKVSIGGVTGGRVYTLRTGTWIPIQTLLNVRGGDPQFSSDKFRYMYAAETWYLVHKIVIDQFYHSNFYQYFLSLDKGVEEQKAFAGAFGLSYEDLDKALQKTLIGDKFMKLTLTVSDGEDGSKPERLSEAEAQAQLALYAAEKGVQPAKSLELAAAALKLEPNNETAKIARLRGELRTASTEALAHDADELCSEAPPSPKFVATCALIFKSAAEKTADKDVQAELRNKSRKFYEQTVQLDAGDLQSWYGLSNLIIGARDAAEAKAFLPRFQVVQGAHAEAGILASSSAALYALAGDDDNAMQYAYVWLSHSISSYDHNRAANYISQLKDAKERKQAAGGAAPTSSQP